jgi:DNA replication licensing factor MCM5
MAAHLSIKETHAPSSEKTFFEILQSGKSRKGLPMDGWDNAPVYHANLGMQGSADNENSTDVSPNQAKSRLREFIRNYRERDIFIYRDQLLSRYRKNDNYLTVDLAHLNAYDPILQDLIQKSPNTQLPLFEEAAKEALSQLIVEREDDFVLPDIHIMLKSDQTPLGMRQITASEVNRLVKVGTRCFAHATFNP